jgi:hypothetical protein
MKPDEAFSALVGRIYDCALDSSLWPEVLGEITQAIGGKMADMIVSHPLERTQRIAALYNWPDELVALAQANAHINPGLPLGLTAPLCEPLCSTRDLDIQAFHSSRYWTSCYAGRGLYDYIVVPFQRTVTTVATWGVIGDEAKGPYGDEDIELARLLSPHIKRSVDISGLLGRERVEVGTLRAALEALASIIGPDGVIVRQPGRRGGAGPGSGVPRAQPPLDRSNVRGEEIHGDALLRTGSYEAAGSRCEPDRCKWANAACDLGRIGAGWGRDRKPRSPAPAGAGSRA